MKNQNFKTKLLLCAIVFGLLNPIFSQNTTFGEDKPIAEYQFAIRLIPTNESMYFQCALVKFDAEGKLVVKQMPAENWARQAFGFEKSSANPEKLNLIVNEYKLFELPAEINTMMKSDYDGDIEQAQEYQMFRLMIIMNNMWRIRYRRHPYEPAKIARTDSASVNEVQKNMQFAGIDVENGSTNNTNSENKVPENFDYKGWANNEDPKVNGAPNKAQMAILKKYGVKEISDFVYGENVFKLLKDALDPTWQNNYMNASGSGDDPSLNK